MNEIAERAGKALYDADHHAVPFWAWGKLDASVRQQWVDRSLAVIASIRECSPEMLEAGCMAHPEGDYHAGTTLGDIIAAEWIAMVDEILE